MVYAYVYVDTIILKRHYDEYNVDEELISPDKHKQWLTAGAEYIFVKIIQIAFLLWWLNIKISTIHCKKIEDSNARRTNSHFGGTFSAKGTES